MVQFNFNAAQVRPNVGGADVLPSGVYDVQITNSEMKPTKDGAGLYLQLSMSVINGDHKGSSLVDRLNVQNNNAKAVEIAYGTLSAICHVTGVLQMQATEQLHGRPFKVKVLMSPRADDPTKQGNEIKGYYDINGNEPGTAATTMGNAGAPAQPAPPPAPPAMAQGYAPAPAPAAVAATPYAAPAAPAPAPAPAPSAPPAFAPAAPAPAAPAVPPWAQS